MLLYSYGEGPQQNLSDSTSHNYFLVIFCTEKAGHFFKFQSSLPSILTDDRKRFLCLNIVFTYQSRLHARVKSICQSYVVRLHGYGTPIHRVGTFLVLVVVAALKLT